MSDDVIEERQNATHGIRILTQIGEEFDLAELRKSTQSEINHASNPLSPRISELCQKMALADALEISLKDVATERRLNAELRYRVRDAEKERDEAREFHAKICERVAVLETQYRKLRKRNENA